MAEINIVWFLAVAVIGALVQTLTGFAMALIIMVSVALFAIADIAFAAAVVSFISLVNTLVALRKGHHHIDWQLAGWMLAGLLPAMGLGLALLGYLSAHYYELLRLTLGIVVIIVGTSMMTSPQPFPGRSGTAACVFSGTLGGVLGGLYGAAGGPLAYFAYRQPVAINTIRFSLLATIAVSTAVRALMVAVTGQMTMKIVLTSAIAVPVVVLVTLMASQLMQRVPDRVIRILVYVVLIVAGGSLIYDSLSSGSLHP